MDTPLLPALPGYENPQLIAHGTTALVFRATQTTLNRPVAIKVITTDTGEVPVNTERELATTVALSSQPHIVSIIDTGVTSDDRPYIVMEYCEGGSYAQILRREGPLPLEDVVEVGISIGEALHAAHQAGILHRDVKPSNILRSRFGPALTDFGIARAPDELSGTLTREMMTPHHASPEALLHQAQSGSSDVYSLASTMWTLLVGHPPFVDPDQPGLDMYAFRDRVLHDPLPPMPRDDVPDWLVSELTRAMAKMPSGRHATAREFADALRRAMLGFVPTSPPTTSPPTTSPPTTSLPSPSPRPPEPIPLPGSWTATAFPSTADVQDPGTNDRISVEPPPFEPSPAGPSPIAGSWTVTAAPTTADVQDLKMVGRAQVPTPAARGDRAAPERDQSTVRNDAALRRDARAPQQAQPPEERPPTHRLGEEDWLVATPAGPRGVVMGVLAALGVIAIAAAAILTLNAGGPSATPQPTAPQPTAPQPTAPQPTATAPTTAVVTAQASGAPLAVRIDDDSGTDVTLSWSDPTDGAVSFVVVGQDAFGVRVEPVPVPQGSTGATVGGLDPAKNYCFAVGALYSVTQIATAPSVCTAR